MTSPQSEFDPASVGIRQDVGGDRNQTIGQMFGGTAIGNVQNLYQNTPQPRQLTLHQLPPDIDDFTGREEELQQIRTRLKADGGTAVVISAVAGMGGVGKSALAVRAAHQLMAQFPDAQFYVDLRGADGEPLDPNDALARWLRAFGLDESQMPRELDERAAMFRSRLSSMRAIVLLDNAANETQVQPLLPGSASCAVIVTSRKRLGALAGAEVLDLAVLPMETAAALLAKVSGREFSDAAEQDIALQIAGLCGRLPLALRIAGGTLKEKRHWTLARYAQQLADERQRLEQLKLSDLDVRASFMLSYRELDEEAARLFRWLGLLEYDFAAELAAVLLEVEATQAEESLEVLVSAQLLEARVDEGNIRYEFHDLVRLLAQEELGQEAGALQETARRRVAHHYLECAMYMSNCLYPEQRREIAKRFVEQKSKASKEIEAMLLRRALAWLEQERQNLLMSNRWAAELADWATVVSLAQSVLPFFDRRGYWADAVWIGEQALGAARAQGDRSGEGQTLVNLCTVYQSQGCWNDALSYCELSLEIARDIGDRLGEGGTLGSLGNIYKARGCWDDAISYYKQSLEIFRDIGDRFREGKTLNNLGSVYRNKGLLNNALSHYEQSLEIFRDIGDRHEEGQTLANIGVLYQRKEQLPQAVAMWQEALTKLHPNSPDSKRLAQILQQAQ